MGKKLQTMGRRPPKFWESLDNVITEVKMVMEKYGYENLPNEQELRNIGLSSIAYAITRYHGGFNMFRGIFGERPRKRGNDRDFIIKKVKRLMKEYKLKTIPTMKKFKNLGCLWLYNAISKHHGGLRAFRKSLGEKQQKTKWRDQDYAIKEALTLMKKYKLFLLPSQREIIELGRSDLACAIQNYHGGFPTFRGILGQNQVRTKNGLLRDIKYAIELAKKFMNEYGFEVLPNQKTLNKLGRRDLTYSIQEYHGGFPVFRQKLEAYMRGEPIPENHVEQPSLLEQYIGEELG